MRMRETAGHKCDRGSKDGGVTNLTRSFSSSFNCFIQLNFADENYSKAKKYAFKYFPDDFLDCFEISYSPALKSRHRFFVRPENIFPFKYIILVK